MWVADDLTSLWLVAVVGAGLVGYSILKSGDRYRPVWVVGGLALLVGSFGMHIGQNRRAIEQLVIANHWTEASRACAADVGQDGDAALQPRDLNVQKVRVTYGAPQNQSKIPLWPWQWEQKDYFKRQQVNSEMRNLHLGIQFYVGNTKEQLASAEVHCAYDVTTMLAVAEISRTDYQVCMARPDARDRRTCDSEADKRASR